MRRPPIGRLGVLLVVLVVGFAGIVVRLSFLQLRDAKAYEDMAMRQRLRTLVLPAGRGAILDRDGRELAMSLDAVDVYADPSLVRHPARAADRVAAVLGLDAADLRASMSRTDTTFVYLARQVDTKVADEVRALHIAGVGFLDDTKRYYPNGALAPQVLGFVGVDGAGLQGLELQYQDRLAGRPGRRVMEIDPEGRLIPQGVNTDVPPVPGENVVTTIDRQIQYRVQRALADAVRRNKARGGTVIVEDPQTGDVLAMATYPWFDPAHFPEAPQARLQNPAIVSVYEPGSVNKVITASAAIEERVTTLEDREGVPDHIWIRPNVFHDAHEHPVETMTIADVIAQSSNVGTIKLALKLGDVRMAQYLARFGLGQATGVGFPGEADGILPEVAKWTSSSMGTIPVGQGVAVTPLQMISAYAAVANGGVWIQPRLVRGFVDGDGAFHSAPPAATRRAVSERTARVVTRLLAYAVDAGTGTRAQIPGYWVAGKTGTAQIPDPNGGYTNKYVASFIGFAPASDPQLVVAAIIDRPASEVRFGALAAAPLFREVGRFALARLRIAPAPRPPIPPHAQGPQ
ncbi:MAG TPA: penicillin-binding protein 2 [Actinomycetota bacterium]